MVRQRDEVRVGLIGVGMMGTRIARQFHEESRATIEAISDISEDNRMAAAEEFGVPADRLYESYEVMLENEDLDAISIVTPHTLHYDQIVAGLEHGLHVFCEKPLVTDLEDARDLARRDEANDLRLMVGYQRHLDPAFLQVRRRYAENSFEPRFMTVEITQDLFKTDSWFTNPELSGGGQIYATGTHVIDALLWTTGLEPASVTASIDLEDGIERLDKHAALTVRFANGAVATVGISGDTRTVREHHHYWDDEGAVYVKGRRWNQRTVKTIDADDVEHSPHLPDPATNKAEAFVEAVRKETEPPATARDALKATAVKEAAYEADQTGERTDIEL